MNESSILPLVSGWLDFGLYHVTDARRRGILIETTSELR